MLRRRRLLSIVLVLALLGAGTGYWLAYGESNPVLRTVTVGMMPQQVVVDATTNRAFVSNTQDMSISMLDARSGTVLRTVKIGDIPTLVVDVPTGRLIMQGSNLPTN